MLQKFTTKPLSHREQQLYLYLESEGRNVFTVRELREADTGVSASYLYVLLHRLERKGWITSVGKGIYLRLPASTAIDGKVYLEDPFLVALKLFDGYLAFQSALRVHGLSEHQPFTVFVASRNRSETVPLLDLYEVKAVKLGKRYVGFQEKGRYRISTLAKTFYDCLWHPQYAGGYAEVLKALHSCQTMSWEEFLQYFGRFASDSLCQRVGYLLSLMSRETDWKSPENTTAYLRSRVRGKTRLDYSRGSGRLIKEWMVLDNVGVEELLSWWYRG